MPNWPTWTKDEEIVLVFFLSCGVCKRSVRELIAYKCNTTRRDEQDMKHHVFQLHNDSLRDRWDGSGRLLAPREEAPKSHAAIPDVWTIDWPESWREHRVDEWLIKKTSRGNHLNDLTIINRVEEDLICQVSPDNALVPQLANEVFQHQQGDEIGWDWMEHRQRELVERHRLVYNNSA